MNLQEMQQLSAEEQAALFKRLDGVRAVGKGGNYSCMPLDTKVLTPTGYKSYSELSVGDSVITYNVDKDVLELDEVLHTFYFEDREVWEVGDSKYSRRATPDHRWVGNQRHRTRGKPTWFSREFRTFQTMSSEFNPIVSAPYVGGSSGVSVEDAYAIGWLLSEGTYHVSAVNPNKVHEILGVSGSISQAQDSRFLKDLEKALYDMDLISGVSVVKKGVGSDVNTYKLKSESLRELLKRSGKFSKTKHDQDWVGWVLGLSRQALDAFVLAFWQGDGTVTTNCGKVVSQNDGAISDAIYLALFLQGKRTRRGELDKVLFKCRDIIQHKTSQTTNQRKSILNVTTEPVFCITTKNGTFVAMQDDEAFITGNCQYGAGAETIARSCKINLKVAKALHEGYWKLNWTIKKIAEMMVTKKTSDGQMWQRNPINGFWYSLRGDKDRFSTLIQGSGAYTLDLWLFHIKRLAEKRNLPFVLLGQFH